MPLPIVKRGVTVLGATGSIGLNTLDVLARHPDQFEVIALTANRQSDRLFDLSRAHRPQTVALADAHAARALSEKLKTSAMAVDVLSGAAALELVATLPIVDTVVAGIVGAAGLLPTLAAVRAGKRVLFANKEPLVMAGTLFVEAARRSGAALLPVDSEHNAVFQCLPHDFTTGKKPQGLSRIVLTCSGGPFRTTAHAALAHVTPDQACAHPNWSMGRKISVDSATLMNKGLEVIEACALFGLTPDEIEVVIHPQSVIHSMVEYVDGSVLAQLGNPDMRIPIANALAWPARLESGAKRLNFVEVGRLEFETPDTEKFPCLRLAFEVARIGGSAPAVLNAANEAAVEAFLKGQIAFTAIATVIESVLAKLPAQPVDSVETVLAIDAQARAAARQAIEGKPMRVQHVR
jgi:1-deoxy-D-xylulose-5-phosphate reductoisomerase